MPNNRVLVGNNNSGNVSGGNILINQSLPCKNGDGMLSYEDYQRLPYCNTCIYNSRRNNRYHYQQYAQLICILISSILVGGYWFLFEKLPNFMSIFLQDNSLFQNLSPYHSTAILVFSIFIAGAITAHIKASKYNNQYFQYH